MRRHRVDVLELSGVGHFLMMEDPQRFNELLIEVIKGFACGPMRP